MDRLTFLFPEHRSTTILRRRFFLGGGVSFLNLRKKYSLACYKKRRFAVFTLEARSQMGRAENEENYGNENYTLESLA